MVVTVRGRTLPGATGMRGMARRLGWGVTDQAISSMSNFAVSLVVARELGAHVLGGFTLAFVSYTVVLNASRGISTDPLLVRFSGQPTAAWRRAVAASTAVAMAAGALGGLICVVVGLLLPSSLGTGFVVLGLGMPLLMLQDSWRFAFFAVGRGARACLVDVVWTAALVAGLVLAIETGHATLEICVLMFVVTAGLAAAVGLAVSGIRPRPGLVLGWLRDHRDVGGRYLLENSSVGVARQLRTFAVGAFAGLAAVGEVRAAEILMGPFLVVLMGVSQVAVPEASRVLLRAPRRLGRFCLGIGAVQGGAAAMWGVTVIAVMGTGLGGVLFGEVGPHVRELLPAVTIGVAVGSLATGATAGLRALADARRSLSAQLSASGLYIVGSGVGADLGGAYGAAWGYAIATTLGCAAWWVFLRAGLVARLAGQHVAAPGAAGLEEAVSPT